MILPGHLAAGYLTTYAVLHVAGFQFSGNENIAIYTIGTLLGDGPDFDIFLSFLKKKTLTPAVTDGHRGYITHTAIFWFLFGCVVFFCGDIFASDFVKALGLLVWLSPWSHLLCDSFVFGAKWFWPLSDKFFTFPFEWAKKDVPRISRWSGVIKNHFKSISGIAEILVTALALAVFIWG